MSLQFQDTEKSLSQTLIEAVDSINGEKTITLRTVFTLIGEQGLLMICILLTIPFLIPVSIPGVSTVFGAAIILISGAIILNRVPWLPQRLMDRELDAKGLGQALSRGAEMVAKMERFVHPRVQSLTEGAVMNRLNGLALLFAGVLLIFPFGFIPFSNTLPGLAIMFLAIGILQRDGVFIVLGYVMIVITVIYFGILTVGALLAGQSLISLLRGG
jgi:hypothetical protein